MKFTNINITNTKEILYNDHYVAVPYDCSKLTAGSDGIIKAGTIIPANDDTAIGVLLHDVKKTDDPNGTVVIHGFIRADKLPEKPSEDTTGNTPTIGAKSVLKQITFM